MKTELVIEKKIFKGDDGQDHEYVAFSFKLGEETFRLQPTKEDKRIINYLLKEKGII